MFLLVWVLQDFLHRPSHVEFSWIFAGVREHQPSQEVLRGDITNPRHWTGECLAMHPEFGAVRGSWQPDV